MTGGCPVVCRDVNLERCRRDPGNGHTTHVSDRGYYRWDDAGRLIHTPHWASEEFAALYAQGLPS